MPSVTACNIDRDTAQLANIDKLGRGTYTLRYKVTTDCTASQFMGPLSVLNGAVSSSPHALPSQYATYSYGGDTDASSFAQEFTVEREPLKTMMYYVTVVFSPLDPLDTDQNGDPVGNEPNPLNRLPVFWWDREVKTVLVEKDREDKAIVNKCGRMYDQSLEIPANRGVLVVEFNVATLAQIIIFERTYEGHVNQADWLVGGSTVPAKAAICREVSSSPPQLENGVNYYRCTMRFAFAQNGEVFSHKLVERGFGCFRYSFSDPSGFIQEGIAPNLHKKVFPTGTDPVCLKEDGTRLPDDEEPIITSWEVDPQAQFNALPFSDAP